MGCRNREFLGQETALSDALLLTTMCIIGLPVDVHVKDGSIYSGIFHTACVEDDYGIVLKKARMTKKGNCDANVASGDLIETLVVESEDLVQVVAKGILLPQEGVACNVSGGDVGDVSGSIRSLECTDEGVKLKKSTKTNPDRMQTIRTRQFGDGRSQGNQIGYEGKSCLQKEETTREVPVSDSSCELNIPLVNVHAVDTCFTQSKAVEEMHRDTASKLLPNSAPSNRPASSIVKLNDKRQERHTSVDSSCPNGLSLSVSTSGTSIVEGSTESCVSSSSTPTEMVPPKSSSSTSKEFKLNPGAKVFCPSFANHRSVTPPAMPTVANASYVPDNFPMVPIASVQPEVESSPFVPRSSPSVKFVPYGNLIAGNGVSDSQYSQSVIGHVGSRTQPNRYVSQHHSIQAGPAYMHPNSQNVMVGRLGGQLVYMHPVSHDVNQGVAVFSQVSTHPLLTPHQGHLPKHQGSAAAAAQASLQLCVTPPYVASGQQQFAVQSHFPLPQPPFSSIRPISNGIFGTKFP